MRRVVTILCLATVVSIGAEANAAKPSSADRAFVAKVSQGGLFEVEAGKLAANRAEAVDVRDFATAEVHDHKLVGARLKAISGSESIPIAASLNNEFSSKLRRLEGISGSGFDAAYLKEMASLHDADGAACADEAMRGGSPAFRAFGSEAHRIVQRHIGAISAAG